MKIEDNEQIEEVKRILVEMKVYQKVYSKSERPILRDELARKLVESMDEWRKRSWNKVKEV